MDKKVQDALKLIGYKNPAVYENFVNIIQEGPKNDHYTHAVSFLTNELRMLCGIDEKVNAITSPEDYVSFLMELSSFLKELGCPYDSMIQGHISDRLSSKEERLLLLDYLLTELMAARILRENVPEKKIELKLNETNNAANLRKLLMTLGFSKPPPNITAQQLFQKIKPSVENIIKKGGADLLGNPILNMMINDKQWHTLNEVQQDLHHEYTIRREMLLTRLDCTIQSFQWSDKTKGKEIDINKKYTEKRKELRVEPEVGLSDLLCARDDLAIIEKTSNASVRKNTQTAINKVLIGQVPDRGGRTSEQAPPPPEMPSWQQRTAAPQGGRGGGRGARGGGERGGYNRGNAYDNNQRSNQSFDSAGSYSGGNYQSNRGNYNSDNYSRGNNDNYTRGNNDNYAKGGNYNNRHNSGHEPYGRSNNYAGGFDSAGSYGGYQQEYSANEAKRPKTYDYFQNNKSTYADQYVQESQQNQQYQSREYVNRNRGRGKPNYNRGNNRNYQN